MKLKTKFKATVIIEYTDARIVFDKGDDENQLTQALLAGKTVTIAPAKSNVQQLANTSKLCKYTF
jgi:hypothetical protein